ncbi:MAG: MarR family winged helix-turn-helix transcriptional regulator [Longimicrobiaceae bacterium]
MPSTLREEIKQTRPFSSLEQEAHLSIERTAAILGHAVAEVLKPYGITRTQYNALRILRGAGETGLCRNEVRERLVAQVPDASRLLDRMEAAGLIRRERDTADRRFVTTRITAEGLRVVGELDGPIDALHRRRLGVLDASELETLIRLLARLRDAG